MKIKTSDIEEFYEVRYEEKAPAFFEALQEGSAGDIKVSAPVLVDVFITKSAPNQFYIKGSIKGTMKLSCSCCLADFEFPFNDNFELTLCREGNAKNLGGHEIELSSEDLLIDIFEGDEIDVSKIVQDQIVLLCPIKPLCKADCKGLCPKCGSNLNEKDKGGCKCGSEAVDTPFSALKNFKITKRGK